MNAAQIAAYYNISFITMQTFLLSLNSKTRMKSLLEIVTSATEFEDIQIRRHEEQLLRRIYERVPVKMSEANYDSPHFKAFVLLQAHFSRIQLPVDLDKDQEIILKKILNLLSACVDVLGSDAHLNAMVAIEASQMVVQSCWNNDSPLKQMPHFDDRVVKIANAAGITDIFEFMEAMDPDNAGYEKLIKGLNLNNKQLADVATFANEFYPNVDLSFELEDPDDLTAGSPAYINITITRELEEDEEPKSEVHAPFYPGKKSESWYLVVGEEKSRSLLAIKRVTVGKQLKHKLEFTPATPGKQTLTLYLMSDSYIGVDQAPTFEVNVAEGMDEDEEEEEEEEEEE
jgi:pre-mRNA-splicing helicase BRR2